MNLSKARFDNAFRDAFKIEFDEIISACEDVDYEFSKQYKSRINTLIRGKEKTVHFVPFRNTGTAKAIVLFCTFVIVVFLSCNVDAVTESIQNFFEKSLGDADYFAFNVEETGEILYEYKLTYIPDGFTLYDYQKTETEIMWVYKNEDGEIIKFVQQTLNPKGFIIDIENAEKYNIQTKGMSINVYQTEDCTVGAWIKDSCLMVVSFFGSADAEELTLLIESLK